MKTLALLCLISFLPQTQNSDRTLTLIFKDRNETVSVIKARAEHAELKVKPVLTDAENARFVALALALGTDPAYCTKGQIDAGLCLPNLCITWEQHVAEVKSWWAAPERVYVRCDDPRVGRPLRGRLS